MPVQRPKPEYGSNRRIEVKLLNGEVTITNVHVGSLGDILTYHFDFVSNRILLDRESYPLGDDRRRLPLQER